MTLAYTLQTPFWFYVSDFKNYFRERVTSNPLVGLDRRERFFFFANKAGHVALAIVLPAARFGWGNALLGYFAVYSVASLALALVFQTAHIYEGAHFHEIERFDSKEAWARAQVEGTSVFDPNSRIAAWLYGGLNLQVAHHLFPEICHTEYPKIFPIIERHCLRHGIKLQIFPSFSAAIRSHYRQLAFLGSPASASNAR